MEVIHALQANLTAPGNGPVLHMMQHDGSRQITAQLYAGTAVWAVPEGVTAGIGYTLPDRQSSYYEILSDGTAACTIVGNTVTAVLAPVLTSIAGETKVSIILTKDGIQLSTFPFRIRVDARPGEVNPGAQPDAASPFVGKLYYGGNSGFAIPLGLGDGVRVEQNEDGSLWLIVEGGSGGGISTETANIMISKHNSSNLAHSDIRLLIQGLTTRLNTLANSDDVELDQLAEIVAYIKSNKSLIDAVTTSKVSVTDIVNDLTTNLSNRPLSAAMGMELRDVQRDLEAGKVSVADIVDNLVTLAHDKPLSAAMGVSLAGDIGSLWASMPKKVSQLQNDSGYLTELEIASRVTLGMHTDGLLYLFVDGTPVGTGIELPSGGISGYIDSANNIIITSLPDGSYTVRYEMEDGSTVDIGALVVGAVGPAYTNLAEPRPENTTDYTIWCSNARMGSNGTPAAKEGYTCTNFFALGNGDVIRIKGFKIERVGLYSSDKAPLPSGVSGLAALQTNSYIKAGYSQTDDFTTFTANNGNIAYARLSGWVNGTAEEVIITKNEDIT